MLDKKYLNQTKYAKWKVKNAFGKTSQMNVYAWHNCLILRACKTNVDAKAGRKYSIVFKDAILCAWMWREVWSPNPAATARRNTDRIMQLVQIIEWFFSMTIGRQKLRNTWQGLLFSKHSSSWDLKTPDSRAVHYILKGISPSFFYFNVYIHYGDIGQILIYYAWLIMMK